MRDDRVLGQRGPVGAHDVGLDGLAAVLVGDADDDRVSHPVEGEQDLLDLGRVDVEPARDDELLLAVDDREVPVGVHDRDVTGEDVAVGGEHAVLVLPAPVPGEDLRASDRQLAGLAHGHELGGVLLVDDLAERAGQRQTDAACPAATDRVGVGRRGGLRHAIALDEVRTRDAGELLRDLGRELHGAGDAQADRPEVMGLGLRAVGDRLVDRGDTGKQGGLPRVDRLEHQVQVEAREQHQGAAEQDRVRHRDGQTVSVEQREHREGDLLAGVRLGVPEPVHVGVGDQVAVAEHRALGQASRAAGVLQQREVLPVDRRLPGHRRGALEHRLEVLGPRALGQRGADLSALLLGLRDRQAQLELVGFREVVDQRGHDDVLDRGVLLDLGDRLVDPVEAHDDGRTAVSELVAQLGLGVERVVLHDDGTQAQGREERDDVLRAVRQDERDAVALRHTEPSQDAGEPVDLVLELLVRRLGTEEREGDVVREGPRGVIEQAGEGELRELVRRGDPRRVEVEPRLAGVRRGPLHDRRRHDLGRSRSRGRADGRLHRLRCPSGGGGLGRCLLRGGLLCQGLLCRGLLRGGLGGGGATGLRGGR